MTLDSFQHTIKEQREIELQVENLEEVLKYYVMLTGISELSYYEYDYKLNSFVYNFSVDSINKKTLSEPPEALGGFEYTLIIEEDDVTYGMIGFNDDPQVSEVATKTFERIKNILKKIFNLKKELISQDLRFDIFIITDEETLQFAKNLQKNLDVILNAEITINKSIVPILNQLKQKSRKSIIIYTVHDDKLLKHDENLLNTNDFLIVIGPNDFDLLLFCGHINVYQYLSIDDFVPEKIRKIIGATKYELQNKYENKNNIIGIAGISGGVGTTTIAMNTADLIAKNCPDENVLFIDLSKTKAISNLFLTQNPIPKKTIIDLINSNKFDLEDNLENGLEKVRENFYSINGIQKHIDSDYMEQNIFIEKLLEYISKMSEKFNYVIIDVGMANANKLNTTIYDIVNELWLLSDMSLPHISKLKTFFSLMKRAGLKEKLTFLVNRYDDTINSISVSDVEAILNTSVDDKVNFDFKIPHDYKTLGHCWNYCELASQTNPKSKFIEQIERILISKEFYESGKKAKARKKESGFSLFN